MHVVIDRPAGGIGNLATPARERFREGRAGNQANQCQQESMSDHQVAGGPRLYQS